MHFRFSSSLSSQRKTKRHVFLLLFVLTPVHLNWPSYATGKCYRSPWQLISTMKHWWVYITIHSLTIIKWKMRNLRLNLINLSFFVQYSTFWVTTVLYVSDDMVHIVYSIRFRKGCICPGRGHYILNGNSAIVNNSYMILFWYIVYKQTTPVRRQYKTCRA